MKASDEVDEYLMKTEVFTLNGFEDIVLNGDVI